MAKTANARGFGNVRKLNSGKYQVRYTDPLGIARTGRITFTTKREAEFELSRVRESIEKGTWQADEPLNPGEVDPKTLTLSELEKRWSKQATNSRGQRLTEKYLAECERYVSGTLGRLKNKPIRLITTQDVSAWREGEISRGVLNQTSKAYKHLKQLMDYALENRWIKANPCTIKKAGNYKPSQPPIPTVDQVELMLDVSQEPYKTLFALASQSGLRKGEILELRRKDLDLNPGQDFVLVKVARQVSWVRGKALVKTPKYESQRQVYLPLQASELLRAHLKRQRNLDPEALVFSDKADPKKHLAQWTLRDAWERARDLSGYKGRFHSLRAYHLTQLALDGATTKELQDRAGHSTPQMVMVYQRNTHRETELISRLSDRQAKRDLA
jgi:integrase